MDADEQQSNSPQEPEPLQALRDALERGAMNEHTEADILARAKAQLQPPPSDIPPRRRPRPTRPHQCIPIRPAHPGRRPIVAGLRRPAPEPSPSRDSVQRLMISLLSAVGAISMLVAARALHNSISNFSVPVPDWIPLLAGFGCGLMLYAMFWTLARVISGSRSHTDWLMLIPIAFSGTYSLVLIGQMSTVW